MAFIVWYYSLREIDKEEMAESVICLFKHIQENQLAYNLLLHVHPDALLMNRVKGIVKQFIVDGTNYSEMRDQLIEGDFDLIVSFYTGAYFESILWWIQNDYQPSAEEMAKTIIHTGINGSFNKPLHTSNNE